MDRLFFATSGQIHKICTAALIAGFVVFSPVETQAQDMQTLLDRIERLERDIRTLNTQIARGEGAAVQTGEDSNLTTTPALSGSGVARIDARITSLENDVRSVTSVMEGLDHQIFQLTTRLDKLMTDIDFRLSELERGGGNVAASDALPQGEQIPQVAGTGQPAQVTQDVSQTSNGLLGTITENELQQISSAPATASASATDSVATEGIIQPVTGDEGVSVADPAQPSRNTVGSVQTATVAPAAPSPEQELSPQDQYTQAFGLLRQAKYDDAAIALEAFVRQHPDDALAPNARYWLGETFYVRSEFVRAAEIFFEGYKTSPDGPKAPDTLLKLGMSLRNLGKNAEACAAFAKLASDFPNVSANVRNTSDRERLRSGC